MLRWSFILLFVGCGERASRPRAIPQPGSSPCETALSVDVGSTPTGPAITALRELAASSRDPVPALERLGWAHVREARRRFDPGLYVLADAAARCIEEKRPDAPEALLLRGHVLHSQHRFLEAEAVARRLVARRGAAADHGLLGDALLDEGRVADATDEYQKMMDEKPGLEAYARAAEVRRLGGDLDGAIALAQMAVAAGSPRAPDELAWVYTRLAFYAFAAGRNFDADAACRLALRLEPDHAPARALLGRMLLVGGQRAEAIEALRRAVAADPLPEYEWALADALRSEGQDQEAGQVEERLVRQGEAMDPRSLALYLATRRQHIDLALRLARREMEARADVYTEDALAWALWAAGRNDEASVWSERALAHETIDARLLYHAGVIASSLGKTDDARRRLRRAQATSQTLLPSERTDLGRRLATL